MQIREQFHKELSWLPDDTVSFDVTAAAQWFLRDNTHIDGNFQDFPAVISPFPSAWIEYSIPSMIRGASRKLVPKPPQWVSSAALIETMDMSPDMIEHYRGNRNALLSRLMTEITGTKGRIVEGMEKHQLTPKPFDDLRWIMSAKCYISNREMVVHVATSAIIIDSKGKAIDSIAWAVLENLDKVSGKNYNQLKWLKGDMKERISAGAGVLLPFMFCLSLLHCRNVNIIDKPPAPAPILKQRAKKGIPFIQYKTLDVVPLRTVNKQKGEPQPSEPKALHFVRGHFKEFSDKGLFGKYKGVYWWNNQVRGDVSKGIIDKDYRVRNG